MHATHAKTRLTLTGLHDLPPFSRILNRVGLNIRQPTQSGKTESKKSLKPVVAPPRPTLKTSNDGHGINETHAIDLLRWQRGERGVHAASTHEIQTGQKDHAQRP